ncbi:MAG: imidazolonepropionase [Proteobacteria bacterium]|jgi:imidazolonepropionase|nr:imidazolonepropionase [Pseudomonadota bacterium]MDA1285300.1 imidazolonepropionase [Pseudomonadota bacterium]
MSETVFTNCRVASMVSAKSYGLIEDAGIAVRDGRITWVGAAADLSSDWAENCVDLGGRLVTPAFIDCHTHLVFGGNRALEFEMRLEGASYEQVARAGGGIVSSMSATRAANEDELVAQALPRLDAMIAEGVCLLEIKSGYGLTIADEIKMLRAARRLAELRPVRIVTSWLAAHALPPEYAGRPDAYIDEVAIAGLQQAHDLGLVDAVDGFCEGIAFSPSQIGRVFDVAKALGLPVKLHAEQLSNLGGASLAASYNAMSADHLEYLDQAGIDAMAKSGTVAVLLPGAFYTLRETKMPPVQALRDAGVSIAIATDGNPGSSPMFSPILTLNMACTMFRLTPEEALAGLTREAARALGQGADTGTIEAGKRADMAVWDVAHPAELAYRIGFNSLHRRIYGGAA